MPCSTFKWVACIGLTLGIASASQAAVTPYFVTDLGSLGGDSVAYAINNNGQVVGTSGDKAFIWDRVNGMRQLQGLGGDYAYAYAINDAGTAVGGAWTADGEGHATMWDSGLVTTDISPGVGQTSTAFGINAGGTTVMQAVGNGSQMSRMVIRSSSGQITDYGTIGGNNAYAWAINNTGTVALQWDAYGLPQGNPNSWSPTTQLVFHSKPEGSTTSALFAISNVKSAAGATYLPDQPGGWRAIFWEVNRGRYFPGDILGITTTLPTLGGATIAWGMNDENQIVGTSSISPSSSEDMLLRAFLYDEGLIDLNTLLVSNPGWLLLGAQDINEDGQIVGWGINPLGQRHAFLLTPVPEPGTMGLLLLGAAACLRRGRRRVGSSWPDQGSSAVRTTTRRRHAGVTITEVVVTAAITTVTFTLLLPGIGMVRSSSAVTRCQSNAKFLCGAFLDYAVEHQNIGVPDERKPAYTISNGTVVPTSNSSMVTSKISKLSDRKLSWFGILEDGQYITPDQLGQLICPVIPNAHRRQTSLVTATGVYNWPTDYVINSFGINASIELAEEPARNVLVGEPNMDRGAVNYMVTCIEPGTYGTRSDIEQHRAGSLSFGFVDGHAARVPIPDAETANMHERAKIILTGSYPQLALSLGSPAQSLSTAYSNVMWWHRGNVRGTSSDRYLSTIVYQPPNNLTAPRTLPPQ